MTRRWLAALAVVGLAALVPATPSSAAKLVPRMTATWAPTSPDAGTLTAHWSGLPADATSADFIALNSDATFSTLQPPTLDWTSADGRQLDVHAVVVQGGTTASFKLPVSPSGHYYVQLIAQEADASGQCGGTCVSNLVDVTTVGAAPTTTAPPPPPPPSTTAPRPTTTAPRPTSTATAPTPTTGTTAAPTSTSGSTPSTAVTTTTQRPTTTTSAPPSPVERLKACAQLPDAVATANRSLAGSPSASLEAVTTTLGTCTAGTATAAPLGRTAALAANGSVDARPGARGFVAQSRLVDVQDGTVHLLEHGTTSCGIDADLRPSNPAWWTKTPCATIVTPNASAVLTGTEVVVTVTPTATVFEVLAGSIQVADLEATTFVRVGAGQTTTVVVGSSPIAARAAGPVTRWWSHPGTSLLARWWIAALALAALAVVVLVGALLRRRGRAAHPVTA